MKNRIIVKKSGEIYISKKLRELINCESIGQPRDKNPGEKDLKQNFLALLPKN